MKLLIDKAHFAGQVGEAPWATGQWYAGSGRVKGLEWDPPYLATDVTTEDAEAYRVRVELRQEGEAFFPHRAECSCSSLGKAWCSHAVAAVAAAAAEWEGLVARGPLARQVDMLSEAQAKVLLRQLAKYGPVRAVMLETLSRVGPKVRRFDPKKVHRDTLHQARDVLRGGFYGSGAVRSLQPIVDQAHKLIEEGDSEQAIVVLTASTDAYLESWDEIDDDTGETYDAVDGIVALWLEAILTADLSEIERTQLLELAANWHESAQQYDVESMAALSLALNYGSDMRQAQSEDPEILTETAIMVTEAWLRCLKRQRDDEGYLAYAEASGRHASYAVRLVDLGRIEDAIQHARRHVSTAADAEQIIEALLVHDAPVKALALGMEVLDRMAAESLAAKLAEVADRLGDDENAMVLHRIGWSVDPSWDRYQRLKALSGGDWPNLAEELLPTLWKSSRFALSAVTPILLAEGRVQEAISMLESAAWVQPDSAAAIGRAGIAKHAEWVVGYFRQRAMAIVEAGKSADYETAATWLGLVRDAYGELDRSLEWRQLKQELLAVHSRKRALVPLLEAL